MEEKKFDVFGMTCAACSARVEKAVLKVKGVSACSVNLLTNSMTLSGSASSEEIIRAVKDAGYSASEVSDKSKPGKENADNKESDKVSSSEISALKKRLVSSVCLLLVLLYFSMGHMMWNWPTFSVFNNHICVILLEFIITTIILVINRSFFIRGFKSAFKLSPNMDTLVALGSGVSYLYSIIMLFLLIYAQGEKRIGFIENNIMNIYFESSSMIVTLITVGKLLESVSKGKTKNALDSLMNLAPKKGVVIRDNVEVEVPVDEIKVDDVFVLKPGFYVPVDGVVLEGYSTVDESSLTGESIPVDKSEGESVSGATINLSGYLKCRAVRVGEDTIFSKIIKMVTDASSTKPHISRIADKVSYYFVPAVLLLALGTFITYMLTQGDFSFSLQRAITVLIISCPCALGLATPVAVMVGTGVAAKNGILFKNAQAIETSGKIKIVALDKTGTITHGKPYVTDVIPLGQHTSNELLLYAASLEKKSEHVIASAILNYFKSYASSGGESDSDNEYESDQGSECVKLYGEREVLDASDYKVLTGNGLFGVINGEEVRGGSLSYISSVISVSDNVISKVNVLAEEGKTPLLFTKGSSLLGIIAVRDKIKDDSKDAVLELKRMGVRMVMLTGDNEKTSKAISKLVGIDEVISSVLPDKKCEVIKELSKEGIISMVGDGINDSPALMSSNVGMAVSSGSDIAIDSADVVLMKNSLADVPATIKLSKHTIRNIYENLFWAFIYNIICIPMAMGIFGFSLKPMYGALAMSLSSFCVCMNALRLNLVHIYDNKKYNKKLSKDKEFVMVKTIKIEGMACAHCEKRVKDALLSVDGVISADVSAKDGLAKVNLKDNVLDHNLKSVIEAQDYKVIEIK